MLIIYLIFIIHIQNTLGDAFGIMEFEPFHNFSKYIEKKSI